MSAEQDVRHLRVAVSAGSGEGARSAFETLQGEMGEIAVFDLGKRAMRLAAEERDVGGLMELKSMEDL